MKEDYFPAGGYFLIFCFLLWSCGVQKQQRSYNRETERIATLRTDSLQVQNLVWERLGRKVEVRHIEFTEPDSFSQQFVRSVTQIRMEEEGRKEASSSLRSGKEEQRMAEREAYAVRETVKSSPTIRLWGRIAALLGGGIALVFMWKVLKSR
jgi:hypothetical protein